MYEQINNQFVSATKQFADSVIKANSLAFQNFERAVALQLRTFESNVSATVAFMGEASEVRDMEGAKAIFPKGVSLVKSSTEQFYNAGQEVFGQSMKTGEAIGQIYKSQFEAANEAAHEAVAKTAAKATKTK